MLIWTLLELDFEDTEAKSFCLGFFKLDLRGPAPEKYISEWHEFLQIFKGI